MSSQFRSTAHKHLLTYTRTQSHTHMQFYFESKINRTVWLCAAKSKFIYICVIDWGSKFKRMVRVCHVHRTRTLLRSSFDASALVHAVLSHIGWHWRECCAHPSWDYSYIPSTTHVLMCGIDFSQALSFNFRNTFNHRLAPFRFWYFLWPSSSMAAKRFCPTNSMCVTRSDSDVWRRSLFWTYAHGIVLVWTVAAPTTMTKFF